MRSTAIQGSSEHGALGLGGHGWGKALPTAGGEEEEEEGKQEEEEEEEDRVSARGVTAEDHGQGGALWGGRGLLRETGVGMQRCSAGGGLRA